MDRIKNTQSTPVLEVIDEISTRLRQNASDSANRMRIDMYAGDLVTTVSKAKKDKANEEILEEVKKTPGFLNLNTVMGIPDQTTLALIDEAKTKLASPKK